MNKEEIINAFKKKYDLESVKELNLPLSKRNETEVGACIYLINHAVKDFEFYVDHGNNPKDVKRLFYIEYKKIINDFIEFYFDDLIEDIYNMNISSYLKKQLIEKINSEYSLEKYNLKEIVKLLNKEFKKAMKMDNRKIEQIDINNPKAEVVVKIDNYKKNKNNINLNEVKNYIKDRYENLLSNFSRYENYNKHKENIETEIKLSKTNCKQMLNSKLNDNLDELYKRINHEINSLCTMIEIFLEKELEKEYCSRYINKLAKNDYLNDREQNKYLDKLTKANNIYYIYNIENELYNNYFYPKKVKKVKDSLNKHFNHWMMKNPGEKYALRDFKQEIFNMLDSTYVNQDILEKLEHAGMENIYSVITDLQTAGNKHRFH